MKAKILSLGLACLLMLDFVLFGKEKKQINFWQGLFPELNEIVYIIMKDGRVFKQTSSSGIEVYVDTVDLERALKTQEKSYKIKDIAIFIHNHFKLTEFSGDDLRVYRALKRKGFNGLFLLYCHRTNKSYCMEEKER